MTRYYHIVNADTEQERFGAVMGGSGSAEAMRTMIGIVHNVSRETVTLNETKDGQGWTWGIKGTLHYGTARFLTADETPVNPYR